MYLVLGSEWFVHVFIKIYMVLHVFHVFIVWYLILHVFYQFFHVVLHELAYSLHVYS
jgi:hypothetical protein